MEDVTTDATETAAEMHVAKRRRPALPDDQLAPPAPGGGNGRGGNVDRISRLPDAILGSVISLLPTKDGARTQAISRRWLPLWRSAMAPLNLVADNSLSNYQSRVAVISKILSDHPGPARHFSVHIIFFGGILDKVTGWLCSESLTGLEELEVTSQVRLIRYKLPPHALTRFAPTLRVLSLELCQFPDLGEPPRFPHLKQLNLCEVDISEDSLQSMISGCAVLESVSLHRMGFGRLCISSPSLRSISFYALRSGGAITFQELVIEDAPCLERLLPICPQDGPSIIRVIRAPNLKILGFLSQCISTLHLGTSVFQKMIGVSLTTKMRAMKVLALDSIGPDLDAVIDFLMCFPCLEKLYVNLNAGKDIDNNAWKYELLDPIECLELHLKKVVLKNYDGNKRPFIHFANFFILGAKVLKEMEIGHLNEESDNWIRCQFRELQVEDRASRDAHIKLRSDTYATPTNHGHTYDLSTADPFDQPFCGCNKCVRYF